MTRFIMITLLLVCFAQAADAGTIQARSDVPARVFLDGEFVGRTPVDIPRVRGRHGITLRARGQELSYNVVAGGRGHVSRISANFGYAAAPRAIVPRVYGAPMRSYDNYDRYNRYDRGYGYRSRWDDGYRGGFDDGYRGRW